MPNKEIDEVSFSNQREELIAKLRREGISEPTLEAMSEIPRHLFVSPSLLAYSYLDGVLPILEKSGSESTLSQPAVIAEMTDLLELQKSDTVFEIGTATGYQAAILSRLCKNVVTVDVFPDLCRAARERFIRLGINNIQVLVADGSIPFTKDKVFDKIIITASVPPMPPYPPLLNLLKPGGLAVMPLGGYGGGENACEMISVRAAREGYEIEHRKPGYGFVPLRGRAGWEVFNQLLALSFHEKVIENLGHGEQ
jgi:protein-L-isoaspartate(D-aspartate) O-methyltransferase